MSKEKQIEEMAKILCGMKNGCDGCMWEKVHCYERNDAEEIYTAGYRKQIVGEWAITGGERAWNNAEYPIERTCSVCGLRRNIETQVAWNFCPICGANMKGGE